MKQSEIIIELLKSLQKAQSSIKTIAFDSTNPHFKNRYASYNAIVDVVKPSFLSCGLTVIQYVNAKEMILFTRILHLTGQWIEDDGIPLIVDKENMQGLGSAITYAKRYGLQAMGFVVTDEDDDGSQASKPVPSQAAPPVKPYTPPKPVAAPVKPIAQTFKTQAEKYPNLSKVTQVMPTEEPMPEMPAWMNEKEPF